jgi:hypothetical protein
MFEVEIGHALLAQLLLFLGYYSQLGTMAQLWANSPTKGTKVLGGFLSDREEMACGVPCLL